MKKEKNKKSDKKLNDKKLNKSLRLIAKSSFIVFIALFLSKLFTYLYKIIIARYYGPEAYGLFSLSLMVVGWFVAFSALGLNQGLARYIPLFRGKNQKSKIRWLFRKSLKTVFFTSLTSVIILIILSRFISIKIFNEPSLIPFLIYFSFAIFLTVIFEILLTLILAYEEIGWYSFIHKILLGFLKLALISFLVYLGINSSSIYISYILALFIGVIVTLMLYKKKFPFVFKKTPRIENKNKDNFKEILFYSWPLLFYGFIWQLFHWTDSFILGIFNTTADVGIYNAAISIAFLLTVTPKLFVSLFFPMANREYSKGNRKMVREMTKQIGKWVFMINLPFIALMIFFPGAFINLLFGAEYLAGKEALSLLGIGVLFFSLFGISQNLLKIIKKTKVILFDIIIVSIVNVILNIFLVPKYGISGAAFATMLSLILISIIFAFQSYKYFLVIPIRRKMLRTFLAFAVSLVVLYFIKSLIVINIFSAIILALIFLTLYTLFSIMFKAFDKNDKMIVRSFFKKIKSFFPASFSMDQ